MATKSNAPGKERRSRGSLKARYRQPDPGYLVSTRGGHPADLRDRVSWVHSEAVHLRD